MAKRNLREAAAKGSARLVAPDTTPIGSTNHLHPLFCFRHISGIAAHEVFSALAKGLHDLAQLSWAQIQQARRQGIGFELIPRKQIKVPLNSFADNLDDVLSFRLSGRWRLIGHRDNRVLSILYVDPDHGAY